MAEVDVSSYKQPALPSTLDTIDKFQRLQQGEQAIRSNELSISKQQLDLANARFDTVIREINSMPPEAGLEDYFKMGQRAVNAGIWQPEQYTQFVQSLPADPKQLPAFKVQFLNKAMHARDVINWAYGQNSDVGNGQTVTPGLRSNRPGFAGQPQGGFIPQSLPIQQQPPPTTPTVGPGGQPQLLGPQSPQLAPGTVSQPSPLPVGPINNTAIRGQSSNFGGNVLGAVVEPPTPAQSVTDRFPNIPRGPATAPTPLFNEGKQQFVEDQNLATQKLTAVKPAITALSLMKDIRSGPGTETYNKAVAFMKANNIIPTDTKDDPTAIYQEINKYLNQYVQGNGTRSDADLAQRELSNPNVTQQISPALEKLTRTQVGRDRIEAARAGAFESNDYSKYGQHRSTFPPKMDERAFTIDTLEPADRQKLLADMVTKAKKGDKAAIKFFNSLEVAKKTGVFQ